MCYSVENTALLDKTDFPPLQEACQPRKTAVDMRNVMKYCRFWLPSQIKERSKKILIFGERRIYILEMSIKGLKFLYITAGLTDSITDKSVNTFHLN